MNKQTSVEWFIEKVIESGHLWVTDTPSDMTELGKLIEQAKQMHKEEVIEAFKTEKVFYDYSGEQYYNEKFKKD